MKLVVYVTEACSLCDEALNRIFGMTELTGSIVETIDIATDDILLARFGESIPVLELGNQQLTWPFTEDNIRNLVQTVSSRSLE